MQVQELRKPKGCVLVIQRKTSVLSQLKHELAVQLTGY